MALVTDLILFCNPLSVIAAKMIFIYFMRVIEKNQDYKSNAAL